jgi:hypothetical protein
MLLHSEDGGSKVLRNVGILPQHYTMSPPRRSRLEFISKRHSLHPEDGGSEALRNGGILPITMRRRNPEDHNLKLYPSTTSP